MASNYKFSKEEMAAIKAARRETKDKRADARLKALELRAEGMELSEVSQATGFHVAYVSQLVAKYRDHGLEAISGNHYGGNHRNMSFEEEAAILAPFKARAEKGELVEISEIETAYQQAVGHSIGTSQIYYVLHRHGWRKVMPRSRHPKKASEEVIETSKKLRQHRTIRQGVSGRIFVPIQSSENGGILYVFPIFGTAEVEQKTAETRRTQLRGAALV